MQPGFWGGQKKPVRIVPKPLVGPKDPDQFVHLVVIGLYVLITDGPVLPVAIHTFVLEIVRSKTQGDTSPVIGASAQHMGTEPIEFGPILVGIGFPFDLPAPIGGIEVPKGPAGSSPSPGGLVRPSELCFLFGVHGVEKRTRLDHRYLE